MFADSTDKSYSNWKYCWSGGKKGGDFFCFVFDTQRWTDTISVHAGTEVSRINKGDEQQEQGVRVRT